MVYFRDSSIRSGNAIEKGRDMQNPYSAFSSASFPIFVLSAYGVLDQAKIVD